MAVLFMTNKEKLCQLEQSGKYLFTSAEAREFGLSTLTLTRMAKKGILNRLTKGVYIISDSVADKMFVYQMKIKNFIYSHETALFLHGLIDKAPEQYSATAMTHSKPSKKTQEACKIYYALSEVYNIGCIEMENPMGNVIKTYDLERTICDILRNRKKIDPKLIIEAIKRYSALPNKKMKKLYEYAELFKVTDIVKQYVKKQ